MREMHERFIIQICYLLDCSVIVFLQEIMSLVICAWLCISFCISVTSQPLGDRP